MTERRTHPRRRKSDDELSQLIDQDAERTVLGLILNDNECLYKTEGLSPDDFGMESHRRIFKAMWSIASSGEDFDLVTLAAAMISELQYVGGSAYIASLTDGIVGGVNIESRCKRIKDLAARRQFFNICKAGEALAFDHSEDTAACYSYVSTQLLEAGARAQQEGPRKVSEFAAYTYTKQKAIMDGPKGLIGLKTGLSKLDDQTTGWRAGEYYIIGGYAADGKTSFAIQTLMVNLFDNVPCLIFSQEMSRDQLLLRMIPPLTSGLVTAKMIRSGEMNFTQRRYFDETQATIEQFPLWVDDASTLDAGELYARARYAINRHKIQLVVVDYLQLMKCPEAKDARDRATIASATLRQLAKQEKVPVLALSQLSRPPMKGKKERPGMFSLKESGSLEQDAHAVILCYRGENEFGGPSGEDQIFIAKQREGAAGETIKATYNKETLSWTLRDYFDAKGTGYENDSLFTEARG